MNYNDLKIIHRPLGNEQPYFQQPFERIPRYPSEGQPITIAAVMNPMDQAEFVQLHYRVAEEKEFTITEASCIGLSDSVGNSGCERYWVATIPPAAGGQRIEYFLRAGSGLSRAETDIFTFTVSSRSQVDTLHSIQRDEQKVTVRLHCKTSEQLVCLEFSGGQETVDMRVFLDEHPPCSVSENSHAGSLIPATTIQVTAEASGRITLSESTTDRVLVQFGNLGLMDLEGSTRELSLILKAEGSERFYGFGERYNRLDQRGQVIHNRVFEQYKNQRLKSYMPVPFFQSDRGYGLEVCTERNIIYDICNRKEDEVALSVGLGTTKELQFRWYFGSPVEIQRAFSKRTLCELSVPEWALGPWMSSNEWNSQKRVLDEVARTNELSIPATVVVIEAWSDEATFYIWNDAEYRCRPSDEPLSLSDFTFPEEGHWPDPKQMVDALHAEGKRVVLWQIPVVKQFPESEKTPEQQRIDLDYVEQSGLCLREEDGSAYRVRPGWFSSSKVPDLASTEARKWWFSKREYLIHELGIDGFKTDGGEHLWGMNTRSSEAYERECGHSRSGDTMINSFPLEYISSYHEALGKREGDEAPVTFSRSGYTKAGSLPCHWTGDQDSTWEAYRGVIKAMINANISGVPMIGWDIGGFSGEIPTAELYLRSAAAAVFSPIMQYHSEYHDHQIPHVDRTPWNIAERTGSPEVVDIYRRFAQLRTRLIPYLREELEHVRKTGEPLIRPLWLDSPEDTTCWQTEDEYRFGRALLIAPVLEEGQTHRGIYLPEGSWQELETGERFLGGVRVKREVPLGTIPVFRDLSQPWDLPELLFTSHEERR